MRRSVLLAAAVLGALALSAPAGAKELVRAQLCGPAGCTTVSERDDLRLVPTGGETTAGPPAIGPYHELVMTIAEGPEGTSRSSWTVWYVPSSGLIAAPNEAGETTFFPTYGAGATFMKQLAKRIAPYPPPEITDAFVDGTAVTGDAATYARLFTAVSTGSTRSAGGPWVPIELTSAARTPWTNGGASIRYSPSSGVLLRGPDTIKLDAALADDVVHARALGSGGGRTLLPWAVAAGLLAALLLFAALGAVLRRRSPAPEPAAA